MFDMITVHQLRWFERELHTRIPFRYGIATMTHVTHIWLELSATIDGEKVVGQAADHLPPKWFTKNPDSSLDQEVAEMKDVMVAAGAALSGRTGKSVHALIQEAAITHRTVTSTAGWPELLAHFGLAVVERALIDAFCRRHQSPLGEVLRANGLGIELGDFHPELTGVAPGSGLPATSLTEVSARHTVGLGDPLEEADIAADEQPGDGLPVSLSEVIPRYGINEFKIKVAGESDAALARLERVVGIIDRETGGDYRATLDGNEFFPSMAAWKDFWLQAMDLPSLASLHRALVFVEQPVHRDQALADEVGRVLCDWSGHPPFLIDESGASPADLRRALDLGYIGVSHKNCKGIIHGVANRCLLAHRGDDGLRMSGEDLSNTGPLSMPQDLAAQAALGNASVERNGHHYFAGFAGWPEALSTQMLRRFPELYAKADSGLVAVDLRDGRLPCHDVNRSAFGGQSVDLAGCGECWAEH